MIRIILLLTFVSCGIALTAQDQQFTQFYSAPMTLNPALTGAFNGTYRVSAIHRNQWRPVLDFPYQSTAAMFDMRFKTGKYGPLSKDRFAAGLLLYNDNVPGIDFTNNSLMVSGAYHKSLDKRGRHFLSAGFQMGFNQRSVSYERLFFSDQFNNSDGYTNPSADQLPENNIAYGDLNVGLNYYFQLENRTSLFLGAAIHHVGQPELSFYDLERDPEFSNTLYRRFSAQIAAQIPLSKSIQLLPRAMIAAQGPHLQINAGSNLRFLVSELSGLAVHIGGGARPVKDPIDGMTVEAVVGMFGLEYQNVLVGFSYDRGLARTESENLGRNAFELSVAYLGNYDDDPILCPKF